MGTDYSDCVKMKYEWQDKLAVECRLFCVLKGEIQSVSCGSTDFWTINLR